LSRLTSANIITETERIVFGACPVDRHLLVCLFSYEPELLLLAVLVVVIAVCLWKSMA